MLRTGWEYTRLFVKDMTFRLRAPRDVKRHANVGPLHLWQRKREFQIRFLKEAGLKPSDYFADIGCGTLRGGIPIIDYLDAGHYYGIESRPAVLEEAKQELDDAGLTAKAPVLVAEPDLAALKFEQAFDQIWAYAVLIHMTDDILDKCLGFVARHLTPTGQFHANVGLGEAHASAVKWQGFPIVWRSWEFYTEQAQRHGLKVEDKGTLASLGDVSDVGAIDEQHMLRFIRA